MAHKYWLSANRAAIADAYDANARAAITHNFKRGLICREIAAMQLAAAGAFTAEIQAVLS